MVGEKSLCQNNIYAHMLISMVLSTFKNFMDHSVMSTLIFLFLKTDTHTQATSRTALHS